MIFSSAYNAGYRAGKAEPQTVTRENGLKIIAQPQNPYSRRRFISRIMWETGRLDGLMKRLTTERTK